MLTPFLAYVEAGKLRLNNLEAFRAHVATLSGEVVVSVGKQRKKRTDQQNRYYWGCVVKLAGDYCGYHPDEMHETFRWLFLKRESPGRPPTVRSTTSLSTVEFTEYLDQCRQWCAEQGVVVPDPSSYYETETV